MTRSQFEYGLMGGYPMIGVSRLYAKNAGMGATSEVDRITGAIKGGWETFVGGIIKPPVAAPAPVVQRAPKSQMNLMMPMLAIGAGLLVLFLVMRRK